MTREEWDAEWKACFERLRKKGTELLEAQRLARDITAARYGARPAGTPIWLRLAQAFIAQKLGGSRMLQRILTSISFAISVAAPLYGGAVLPESPGGSELTLMELLLIVWPAIVAGYGNYKSNTTKIMPNRAVWTPAERVVERVKLDTEDDVAKAKALAARTIAAAEKKSEKAAEKLS